MSNRWNFNQQSPPPPLASSASSFSRPQNAVSPNSTDPPPNAVLYGQWNYATWAMSNYRGPPTGVAGYPQQGNVYSPPVTSTSGQVYQYEYISSSQFCVPPPALYNHTLSPYGPLPVDHQIASQNYKLNCAPNPCNKGSTTPDNASGSFNVSASTSYNESGSSNSVVNSANWSRRYRSRSKSRHRSRSRSSRWSGRNRRSRSLEGQGHADLSKKLRSRSPPRWRNRVRSRSRDRSSWSSKPSRQNEREIEALQSEKNAILKQWKNNYCHTQQKITERLEEYAKRNEDIISLEKQIWTRSTPAELYYQRDESKFGVVKGTEKLVTLCKAFDDTLVNRAEAVNMLKPKYEPPPRKTRTRMCKHKTEVSSSSDSDSDDSFTDEEDYCMEELQRKQQHPDRLDPEMWFNDPGEMNDGPLCRCSLKSRKSGIRHGIYPGELPIPRCSVYANNAEKLFHYRIIISPPTNFLIKAPTIIQHDEHEYIFEGFSIISHARLPNLPPCKVIRFNIEYTILYYEEKFPENFTIAEIDLFSIFLFKELLELVDLDIVTSLNSEHCPQFHFLPRFVRELPDGGKEILCMQEVLKYLLDSSVPLIQRTELGSMVKMSQYEWQNFADEMKGMIVNYPGKKPCSVRVDQLDRNIDLQKEGDFKFPEIVHFGIRPPQLSYAGNPEYQKAWREYVKFRHLIANMSKPTFDDKRKLEAKENKLQEMRTQGQMKRDVTVAVSAEGFYRTGIMCDIVQHAMLMPVLVCHLRFHNSLNILEGSLDYKFKNRGLLQLALTHPSYRENFGTNPDHARNTLTNCGIRQPEYGDRRIHYMNTRKRGINTLINIMSRFGKQEETESNITHNERLEFLGDAVVEFLSSIHLFFSFPELEEGGLATYRAAIVQNQHLAILARVLKLDQFMLYAHGSDLCHDLELKHAMANCFEALMGALFLDGGIDVADRVFSNTLFKQDPDLLKVWVNLPPHPLQEQEPTGDRHCIQKFDILHKLTEFEKSINVEFNHIRLLARAFTDRSVGYTNLTMGSNQRLEFLGDTVLQLIASEYLYRYFPEHHEGHLSLLRSSLVNNRTQAVVCDDLGMAQYALYSNPKPELKTKDRADLLEAFIGALYVDQGMEYCELFCQVTLFPRLQDFIMNQDWNDPKSKLQQCCLTLRTMDGGEPDIPVYKVIECKGPTNTRVYRVAVYFRAKRLASAMGHSIQEAEMNAAKKALEISHDLFPQLDHQKRVIVKSMRRQRKNKSISKERDTKSPESYSRRRFRSKSPAGRKGEDRRKSSRRTSKSRSSIRSVTPSSSYNEDGTDSDGSTTTTSTVRSVKSDRKNRKTSGSRNMPQKTNFGRLVARNEKLVDNDMVTKREGSSSRFK
ncbi:ribonuclease 3 isoform X1 [Euwallacea fornicatus]|uniref:ribonuclease 3 isoform X1 n=1 Tax=Euwallacea fornicatus TaxID=995702 RepID=UPI00338EF4BE